MKRVIAFFMSISFMIAFIPIFSFQASARNVWKYGLNNALGYNETTYRTIALKTTNGEDASWRYGSMSANGEMAFTESCDPNEDVFLFNNQKIVTDNGNYYETPVFYPILTAQREGAIRRSNTTTDFPFATYKNTYSNEVHGTTWNDVWPRHYQPAAQLRIKNNDYTTYNGQPSATSSTGDSQVFNENYNRYGNWETGEMGVQWKDENGNEWNRRSFVSRSDEIIVTYIESDTDLDLTLTMDHVFNIGCIENISDRLPTTDYVLTTEGGKAVAIGMVGKYPVADDRGTINQKPRMFKYGGWGTATKIVTDGGSVTYTNDLRSITRGSYFGTGDLEANNPAVTIKGTKSVMLISKVDRIDSGCNDVNDVKTNLYDKMVKDIDGIIAKYGVTASDASYKALLAPHAEIHGGMFNNVRIDLCATDEEKADRELTNERLIQKQNSDKSVINKAFLERVYNNGRFGLICASGYGSTRLGGIWQGAWMPMWSGDYTLDANTNLQVSGMNTGNMEDASQGYINFIVRMVADWETDAANIYGMTNAIKAPPRVDGTGQAGSYHFLNGYPHIYVNGITDWLIIPMFEYYQCYGNRPIKVGKDVDIERQAKVLDLTPERIEQIKASGYMDLEKDILYPMLVKTMNFWLQFVDERFYTDGSGVIHNNDGTTLSQAIADGDDKAVYIYTPGYSPENTPTGWSSNSVSSLAYNSTMDIAATYSTLWMARTLVDRIKPDNADELLSEWASFEKLIPPYMYTPEGQLKEWAAAALPDRNQHRHESQAYGAWPAYESQYDPVLAAGIGVLVDKRTEAYGTQGEATESHGAMHKTLVEARLKRPAKMEQYMRYLLTNNYQYSSMLTSHNRNRSSNFCSDSAFGLIGAVNESLMFSDFETIEILPTLIPYMASGSITGLRARNNTLVNKIEWDINAGTETVTMTTDEDVANIRVKCGLDWGKAVINGVPQKIWKDDLGGSYIDVTLLKGVPVTVDFSLAPSDAAAILKDDTLYVDIYNSDTTEKEVMIILAAYDKAGRLTEIIQPEDCTLEANKSVSVAIPVNWKSAPDNIALYIWHKDSYIPFTIKIPL